MNVFLCDFFLKDSFKNNSFQLKCTNSVRITRDNLVQEVRACEHESIRKGRNEIPTVPAGDTRSTWRQYVWRTFSFWGLQFSNSFFIFFSSGDCLFFFSFFHEIVPSVSLNTKIFWSLKHYKSFWNWIKRIIRFNGTIVYQTQQFTKCQIHV